MAIVLSASGAQERSMSLGSVEKNMICFQGNMPAVEKQMIWASLFDSRFNSWNGIIASLPGQLSVES